MSNEIATVSAPQTQQVTTQPTRSLQSLAVRLFDKSNHAESEVAAETPDQRVTRQDAEDYKETLQRLAPEHVQAAQRLMATHGSEPLRKVVAERGLGSNVWVLDMAARLQHLLDAKDREIAELKRGRR